MANVVKSEMQTLITDDVLEMYEQLAYYKQQVAMFEHQYKEQLKALLVANDIKSYSDEYVNVTYIPSHTTKRVDTDKLKEEGLYDEYVKDVEVKESIRIKLKGANDD